VLSLLAASLAALAVGLLLVPARASGARLERIAVARPNGFGPPTVGSGSGGSGSGGADPRPGRLRRAAAALVGVAAAVSAPVPWPGALGVLARVAVVLAVAGCVDRALVRIPGPATPAADPVQSALALDLLAAALAAGSPPAAAAEAVGAALDGPPGRRLTVVGAAARLGASAEQAWSRPDAGPSDWDGLGRLFARAESDGTALAPRLRQLADEHRARAHHAALAAARRAGVLAVVPLGLCFLPAFVLVGVVPLVVGTAGRLFA
jgi:hypothetical protein